MPLATFAIVAYSTLAVLAIITSHAAIIKAKSQLNDTIDIQNGLNDKGTGNTGKRQLAEYHDDKMDRNSYGGDSDYYETDEYSYGGNSDYYENGGFDESNLDGRPQRPRFVGRPQGQGGFVGRPQRSENYGDDYNFWVPIRILKKENKLE